MVGMYVRAREVIPQVTIHRPVVPRKAGVKDDRTIGFHGLFRIKKGGQFFILDFNEF